MKRFVVDLAYKIDGSKSYQQKKRFFYNLLENDTYPYKKYFDMMMIALIIISVVVLIREVKSHVADNLLFFNNYIISFIFLIEYLLRLWVNSSVTSEIIKQYKHDTMLGRNIHLGVALKHAMMEKVRYMLSLKALIDLAAILPFFHHLRLFRLFILFRVFKLFRYARSFQMMISILGTKKFEFLTLLIFASLVIFVSSVLIYVMEANNPSSSVNTLYDAIYWSIVTISTVGYGDITAVTPEGRLVAMIVITAGVAVLAFSTSLVVSAFSERLEDIRESKVLENVRKLKRFYLISGYESVAKEVAKNLIANGADVIVLDEELSRVQHAKKDGLTALHFDPGSVDSYKKLDIDIHTQVKAVLCLREDDVENVYTALTVRSISKDIFILSTLENEYNHSKLEYAGVNEIVYAKELVGMIAKEFVGQPVAFEIIHALRSDLTHVDIEELLVSEQICSYNKTIGELNPARFRIVLLGIYKKEQDRFIFNPDDDVSLEVGDYLLVIGNDMFLKEYERSLQGKKVLS